MSQTELLNKCEAERKYLHKVYEETKAENNKLKEELNTMKKQFNSLMTEEQKDICNGEAMELGEPTLQTPQDWVDRIRMFLEERDTLAQAVEDLEEEEGRLELENKKLKEEVQFHQESATVAVVLANNFKEELDKLKEELEAEKFHSQQLKDCSYEEYCEYVSENKLIKEFEDLKNELGELKKEKEEYSKAYTATLKRRNWDAYERKKLREEIKKLKEQLK